MRNHRFRLSDMIPNAWFYKLKGMAKKSGKNQNNNKNSCIKKHQNQNQSCSSLSSSSYSSPKTITTQRKSYYFTRELNCPPPHHHISPEPPRKSSNKRRSAATAASRATTPRNLTSSVSAGSDSPLDSTSYSSEHDSPLPDLLPSAAAAAAAPATFDGMLSQCEFDTVSKPSLPPIITKPIKFDESFKRIKPEPNQNQLYRSIVKKNTDNNIVTRNRGNREKQRTCSVLKKTGHSPGLKLRTNSPRIVNRRITQGRKSTSIVGKSFAVVKSSNDPQRDFMESMVEMIVENNIRGSKDLENLLACYLSLNANEYHDLIIEVFKQIWFDITDVRLK